MQKYVSEKITIISLLSMIMVIYIHSYNIANIDEKLFLQPENKFSMFNIFLQNLISEGFARIAVPIFFIISGFLFFKNFTMKTYKEKISKRVYTLFIPYIFWSLLAILIYFILQSIPGTGHYFKNTLIINQTFSEFFVITFITPRNFPLWFLRDLILLTILSPIIYYFIIKHTKFYFLTIAILWFIIVQRPVDFSYYKAEPIFFFSLGAYISLFQNQILSIKINDKNLLMLSSVYIIMLFSKTTFTLFTKNNEIIIILLHKFSILLGIILLWFFLDKYFKNNKYILFLSRFTFLYYVFHEPILMILQRGLYGILGETTLISITLYILLPILMILFLTILGLAMKKYIPKITNIITGNRL